MRYDSPFFNSERYYDPTAGAVLSKLASEERRKNKAILADMLRYTERPDDIRMFAYHYAKQYESENGRKANGKAKSLGDAQRNENYIRAYLYCTKNADVHGTSLELDVEDLFGISGRRIRQCFTRTGQLGKLVNAWIGFVENGGNRHAD